MIATLLLALATDVSVTLKEEAQVSGAEIRLGEIAEITADDPAVVERYSDLRLGYAPSPGHSRLLVGWRLAQEIDRLAPGSEKVVLRGSSAVRVFPKTRVVAGASLEAAARTALGDALGGSGWELNPVTPIADLEVPEGDQEPTLEVPLRVLNRELPTHSVPIRVMVDGKLYRTVWSQWKAEVWRVRPTLRVDVTAGTILDATMIGNERRLVPASSPPLKIVPGLLVGSLARRDIKAGEVLGDDVVERPKVIQRDQRVTLSVRRGQINARVAAVALEEGAVGDQIRVEIKDNGREMTATVLSRSLVEIQLGS